MNLIFSVPIKVLSPSPLHPLANHLCQVVQLEALPAADGELFVVVLPGGEKEELAALAGIHALAFWFSYTSRFMIAKIQSSFETSKGWM